ncbi:MAG: aldo/keto reductase [Clostridia bacterium]|nr:aldo/keto reductase [Clostridia bacterium]
MTEDIKMKLGFGCMRLPMTEDQVDLPQFKKMVDEYIAAGGNYFDTAHGYIDGKSESALKPALTERYPRSSYLLADKLSGNFFEKEEDIRPFFESQLHILGVDYLDFYLMHSQNAGNYEKYTRTHAYEIGAELKKEGKIRYLGFSFHDKAEVLDRILTDHPEVDFVQIQFNYLDYEDPGVQSRACYEVLRKHNKPMVVMEPVKGGRLARLSENAGRFYRELGDLSPASYAIRFAAGMEGCAVVLSGMSNEEQMLDNLSYMKDFKPLSPAEREAVLKTTDVLRKEDTVDCTGCRYCVAGCPQGILIPDLFTAVNEKQADFFSDKGKIAYEIVMADGSGKASDCVKCGACEEICPQHLKIRRLLGKVRSYFE